MLFKLPIFRKVIKKLYVHKNNISIIIIANSFNIETEKTGDEVANKSLKIPLDN
ncbi:MAG: hypothetical protein ACTSRH_15280 [Promethearchaeota archaeon]